MKKLKALVISIALFMGLLPSVAMATTYNNDVPSGLTLQAWSVGPNQGGKKTVISFSYSGGFRASNEIDAPFDSSWHSLDDVRPILLAEQEGYGNYLGGTNGTFGSNIKFSSNVLAAMKVQNFNPSQVGGADISPSSTTLNSDQIAWLQKVGYSVPTAVQNAPASTPTTASESVPAQTQSHPQPSQPTATAQASSASSGVKSDQVGKTATTPSGPMTQDMVAADQKLAAENPPNLNPANIPIAQPNQTSSKRNIWIEVAAGVAVLVIAVVVGRIVYIKRKSKLA